MLLFWYHINPEIKYLKSCLELQCNIYMLITENKGQKGVLFSSNSFGIFSTRFAHHDVKINRFENSVKPVFLTIVSIFIAYSQTQQPVQSLLLLLNSKGTVQILQVLQTQAESSNTWYDDNPGNPKAAVSPSRKLWASLSWGCSWGCLSPRSYSVGSSGPPAKPHNSWTGFHLNTDDKTLAWFK